LTMGSNGKHVTVIGTDVMQATGPVYWGQSGTNGQHLYQALHQGTSLIPCDYIVFAKSLDSIEPHHDLQVAHAFAQSEALAFGRSLEEVKAEGTPEWLAPHLVCEGNRPSNTICAERLTPETLGKLIALYEHAVFTEGVIWNINPFDQWGVRFAGELAQRILPELEDQADHPLEHDSSTNALIRRYRKLRASI